MTCVSKSPNKHNRIYLVAEPMDEKLINAINRKEIREDQDKKKRGRVLADEYGWDITEARKIWSFGMPPDCLANLFVDTTKGVQYLAEIKDSVCSAFRQATAGGIICDEALRGVKFLLQDVVMHADSIHRGAGQIMPPTKRAIYACQFKSGPAVLEPLYLCDITVPQNALAGVYSTLNQRRGVVEETVERAGTPLVQVKALLPVLESFGFTNLLRANTSGKAFPQMIFSHFQPLNGDVFEEGSTSNTIALDVRKRKGLKVVMPKFSDYYDKI